MEHQQGPRVLSVPPQAEGQRLDNFLLRHLRGIPRSLVYRLVRKGAIRINGRRAKVETRVAGGDQVRVPALHGPPSPDAVAIPEGVLRILRKAVVFEDDDYLVLDKPAGLAVHGGTGLAFGLIEAMRELRPGVALELGHRLDRETSGCLVLTKSRRALTALHSALRAGGVEKRYLALLVGRWQGGARHCDLPIARGRDDSGRRRMRSPAQEEGDVARSATSLFTPLEGFGDFTLMEVNIGTGRTHQIRVHASALGHPVAGDHDYGDAEANRRARAAGLRRMFLHAQAIRFPDWQGEIQLYSTPLPGDLQPVLDALAGGDR
ncbi:Ribosomal large subunit pseudouridine synthase C [Thioalkalivibrio nitratireducens DSM 14787]|uniref:Pseudouridine synthase n=1 Tax=Thioalkalivibrio nitratireducens (strain DSM 14787 / UNIQEM 213 / ALEN2) TaxID=1255043 RepID=L0DV58_THIND|nr:RluA family pseudouridine synthase [Thioalkalivibrio nitratireducens]AGA33489.1 Ribosomal large subunit pseudouridine synthase C [Thioalkalivibrio nitratireducens DSM 14787]